MDLDGSVDRTIGDDAGQNHSAGRSGVDGAHSSMDGGVSTGGAGGSTGGRAGGSTAGGAGGGASTADGAAAWVGAGGGNQTASDGGPPGALPPLCRVQIQCADLIEDEPKVDCTFRVTDGYGAVVYADHAGVELRGRSSMEFPKQNYSVELRTAAGVENASTMMGMGKESDWILDGSWVDRSFMRNDLVYGLHRDMGWYAAESRYCTLELNDQRQGIYRFSEKIKRDDDRIAMPEDDGSGSTFLIKQDLGGVVHFAIDKRDEQNTWKLEYPKQDVATQEQIAGVQAWLDGLDAAMNGSDPGNMATGVFSYLDLDETADWLLVEEFAKNVDAFAYSLVISRGAGSGAKLIPWDIDLAFGQPTIRGASNEAPSGWISNRTPFVRALTTAPVLLSRLGPRWHALRAGCFSDAAISSKLDALQAVLEPTAISANFELWPIEQVDFSQLYAPYSLYRVSSYADEVAALRPWIRARLSWIDDHIDTYPN